MKQVTITNLQGQRERINLTPEYLWEGIAPYSEDTILVGLYKQARGRFRCFAWYRIVTNSDPDYGLEIRGDEYLAHEARIMQHEAQYGQSV